MLMHCDRVVTFMHALLTHPICQLGIAWPVSRVGGGIVPDRQNDKLRPGISFLPQRNVRTNQYTRLDGCEILGQKRWKRLLG